MDLKKADTPEAREIWAKVERAAARCPEWMREKVKKAVKEALREAR